MNAATKDLHLQQNCCKNLKTRRNYNNKSVTKNINRATEKISVTEPFYCTSDHNHSNLNPRN
jgi:hypothetical protein